MKKILLLAAALCCGAVSRCTASDDSVRTKSNNKKENLLQLFDTLCRELRDFLPKEEMLNGMIRGVQEGYVKFTDERHTEIKENGKNGKIAKIPVIIETMRKVCDVGNKCGPSLYMKNEHVQSKQRIFPQCGECFAHVFFGI